MSNSQVKERQGLLFSEPSIAETGVWCSLNEGIDPVEWASLCRYIGKMSLGEFKKAERRLVGSPDSLRSRVKRLFDFSSSSLVGIPLVSIGPSGIGGEFQREG
jgi:hypothetical protein